MRGGGAIGVWSLAERRRKPKAEAPRAPSGNVFEGRRRPHVSAIGQLTHFDLDAPVAFGRSRANANAMSTGRRSAWSAFSEILAWLSPGRSAPWWESSHIAGHDGSGARPETFAKGARRPKGRGAVCRRRISPFRRQFDRRCGGSGAIKLRAGVRIEGGAGPRSLSGYPTPLRDRGLAVNKRQYAPNKGDAPASPFSFLTRTEPSGPSRPSAALARLRPWAGHALAASRS